MPAYKITMLGAAGVGKTALTIQTTCDYFVQAVRTPGWKAFYSKEFSTHREYCLPLHSMTQQLRTFTAKAS